MVNSSQQERMTSPARIAMEGQLGQHALCDDGRYSLLACLHPPTHPHPANSRPQETEAATMIKPIYPNLRDAFAGVDAFII